MSARYGFCECGRVWMHVDGELMWDENGALAWCHECIDSDDVHLGRDASLAWSVGAFLLVGKS